MNTPLRPWAMAAVAALPASFVAPVAQASPLTTAVALPSFGCAGSPSAGGSIGWDGVMSVSTPTLSYAAGSGVTTSSSPLDCTDGVFAEAVARKSGDGQKDFLKVSMTEVFAAGVQPVAAIDTHIKFNRVTVLLDGGGHRTQWNVSSDFVQDLGNGLPSPARAFLGLMFDGEAPFDGDLAVSYVPLPGGRSGVVTFTLPNQAADGRLRLTADAVVPTSVPEPGTLALLATGLIGAGAAARRRRGW